MSYITHALLAISLLASGPSDLSLELVDANKIWDQAPHNAFTDLVRFHERWYCVFREGTGHVSGDGALRVIVSDDGKTWSSAALLAREGWDLRDAKITVTPHGQLMLNGAACIDHPAREHHQSLAWFSDDGTTWSQAIPVAQPDDWLWRVSWHEGKAYGIGYTTGGPRNARLYVSDDGKTYETLVDSLDVAGFPNESSLVFDPQDSSATCLLRRDGEPSSGLVGTALPPYTDWSWRELGVKIGGPHLLRLPDGRLLAAVRLYDGGARTSLCQLDAEAGTIRELLSLPSGGDTSYAGLLPHDGQVWVSYYSSHEGKTSIYLARVRITRP